MGILSKLFPSHNEKELKKLRKTADKIEALADKYKAMSNEELAACTPAFRARLAAGETLDDLLPDAFAAVREAADRVLHMRHFYVQLIGGIVLHQGRIAEMRTGEGKTLVATLPVYLNALAGKGVHVVTVNEYLAERDAGWMGNIYEFMGLTVGVNKARMKPEEKRAAYNCDITYTTNNEVGFDYLRDNMAVRKEDRVMRGLDFAIVDEVDSILIDEARTPLIISGRGGKPDEMYELAQKFYESLTKEVYRCPECGCEVKKEASVAGDKGANASIICPECGSECENVGDYEVVVKSKSVYLNESGANKAYAFFKSRGKLNAEEFGDGRDITTYENQKLKHYIDNALTANVIMKKDENYIVVDNEIIIVDEFTGRQMIGRRFSNGLHQAIEAKEKVKIRSEDKTYATITFQNLFRLYRKLSGMTGTAKTEENEFENTYRLDVVVIPTNKEVIRKDEDDKLFVNEKAKFRAIIEDIRKCHEKGQPVLVGTTSVEKSEKLAGDLKKAGLKQFNVLNARYYDKEAEIVAQAGRPGSITISTNMAGRGTDIMLGGNPEYLAKATLLKKGYPEALMEEASSLAPTDNEEIKNLRDEYARLYADYKKQTDGDKQKVVELGGLRIIGTERHESRRIDNQLRGRAGRQGDPGSSVFYLAMDDDILRRFGGETMQNVVGRLNLDENEPISAKIITKQIEAAQARVEDRNFSARKNLLAYDDVLARQREIIYRQRNEVLDGIAGGKDGEGELSVREQILKMAREVVEEVCSDFADYRVDQDEWDYDAFNMELESAILKTGTRLITPEFAVDCGNYERLTDRVYETAVKQYDDKIEAFRKSAEENGLDPAKADFANFERICMLKTVDEEWIEHIDAMDDLKQSVGLVSYAHQDPVLVYKKEGFDMFEEMVDNIHKKLVKKVFKAEITFNVQRSAPQNLTAKGSQAAQEKSSSTVKRDGKKVGRNDPCPCGSGKKYKNCCGK